MNFSENSKVWIYQSTRELTEAEVARISHVLADFTTGWTAHNNQLKAGFEIRYNRFLVLIVDETQAGASGCSIDKSVNLMKALEQEFNITLFDRFNIAYRDGEEIKSVGRFEFEELIKQGKVDAETIVYNNLVPTLADLDTKWEVPFKNSWHRQVFGGLVTA
ncbi:ABC transporter ATPase [Mucilaginibacter sp. PPCGB 2223]|uniref:ABC transporter ATPase n=1 Tax=Mucilaginibacter sp. PPCGB 2223 TaxID=1886027 RepID=UPI000825FEA2|nr:ABC transporter ATPase [Mucilaginibacter sp. PPCGB 2223]OCX51995.1 ABC transporter ATPase [Mucilaginibacter sp. PPCGB 2223]